MYHALVVFLLVLHPLPFLVQDLLPVFFKGIVKVVSDGHIVNWLHCALLARIAQERSGKRIARQ